VLLGMGGGYIDVDAGTMSDAMRAGVIAVLGVATVVCCVAGVAGDMAQDWKVGYNLGGTPWRMEVGGLIGVVAAALFLVLIIGVLHDAEMKTVLEKELKAAGIDGSRIEAVIEATKDEAGKSAGLSDETRAELAGLGLGTEEVKTVADIALKARGIGSEQLPAPQAGLMAVTAKGIISGALPWELIFMGVLFAVALIFVGVPSPMLVAVGMYLPFQTIIAIFAGGVIQWIGKGVAKRKSGIKDEKKFEKLHERVYNKGLLVASGFVAGEALLGILLAILVTANIKLIANPPD
jgi:uncharacterized oligopeptide transporter (OPT) family protein